MLITPKDVITKITGIIMPESINTLENELGGAFTILKSTHVTDGQRYGFLASVIPEDKYRIVINSPAWVYAAPVDPGAYAARALAAGVSAAQREQIVVQHKEEQMSYADYLGSQEAGKELLLYSVGDYALTQLKSNTLTLERDHPLNDSSSPREDGNQDDNVTKIQIQGQGLREAVGSNH